MHGRFRLLVLVIFCAAGGCTERDETKIASPNPAPLAAGTAFDEAATGTIAGTVSWHGDLPTIEPLKVYGLPGEYKFDVREDRANPNQPRIDKTTNAIEAATVFLRKVDPARAKPWAHPPVRVELRQRRIEILQGERSHPVCWVKAGDTIDIVNRDDHFHMLRGRGAAFFSLPFMDADLVTKRRLDKPGVVELSSGAFLFWMRGYVLVADHPYFTRTDRQGRFVLEQVPPGSYELVCWMPSWIVDKRNRDPETGLIIQLDFKAPVEMIQHVEVRTGVVSEIHTTFEPHDFTLAPGLSPPGLRPRSPTGG